MERLRAVLDEVGDAAYRIDPASPFAADGIAAIHRKAKQAAGATRP